QAVRCVLHDVRREALDFLAFSGRDRSRCGVTPGWEVRDARYLAWVLAPDATYDKYWSLRSSCRCGEHNLVAVGRPGVGSDLAAQQLLGTLLRLDDPQPTLGCLHTAREEREEISSADPLRIHRVAARNRCDHSRIRTVAMHRPN